MTTSSRVYDTNGWCQINDNPISRVGVFPYSGLEIDPNSTLGLEPDKEYKVYRPASELSKKETVDSFKLLPWVIGHDVLGLPEKLDTFRAGSKDRKGITGALDVKQKGVDGVIGESVAFKDGVLKATIKVFSKDLAEKLENGVNELSCGFHAEYEIKPGTFGDQAYDMIQRGIIGNHLATVKEGRMGPSIAVLDNAKINKNEEKEVSKMPNSLEKKDIVSIEKDVKELKEKVATFNFDSSGAEKDKKVAEDEKEKKVVEDEDEEDEEEDEELAEDEASKKACAMAGDSQIQMTSSLVKEVQRLKKDIENMKREGSKSVMTEISNRDNLYNNVSGFIGAFDHKEMSAKELASYACDKLGLENIPRGQEVTALTGYLKDRHQPRMFTGDSNFKGNKVDDSDILDYFTTQ